MSSFIPRWSIACLISISPWNGTYGQSPEERSKIEFFEAKIRPVLVDHCYACHSLASGESNGELRLDSASALRKGGTRGSLVPPQGSDVSQSLLLKAIHYDDAELQMPPSGKLPTEVIDNFREWVQQGAIDPRMDPSGAPPGTSVESIVGNAQSHWAYQPLLTTPDASIDSLLEAERAKVGLHANPQAAPAILIRRLYSDLHGLPPSAEQVETLAGAYSLQGYESTVDALLASPHFGERMARHWMDVARYADTKGYVFQEDREYPHAWRYRQWLIDSFNSDLPYDSFASLQIAADRIPNVEPKHLDAMGFLTLGRRFLNSENDIADDRIDVVTRGLIGLSVSCARCHDHKFDPISQADYYSMHSAMVSSREPNDEPSPLRMIDRDQIRPAVVFKRGNPGLGGPTVDKHFVAFLTPVSRPLTTGSGRLEIAQSIVDPRNPLTARVMVNRVWGWMMGAHLVETPSDFGVRCPEPLQRRLLDHLAKEFMEDGWSVRRLVKRIAMSHAYRQQSDLQPSSTLTVDSDNRYWWRANRKRLDFESMRDHVLASCGSLNRTIGGPSIKMIEPPFSTRRTLYAHIDRQNLEGVFRSFDFASPDTHVPMRLTTTVPQQGLFMMNSPMIQHDAAEFAKQIFEANGLQRTAGKRTSQANWDSIIAIFRAILQRNPTENELEMTLQFVGGLQGNAASIETVISDAVWSDVVQSLLCTNEFAFVD